MRQTNIAFSTVMRGFDRDEVIAHISGLDAELNAAYAERQELKREKERLTQRVAALERRLEEIHLESQSTQVPAEVPTLAGLGARMEKILRLAEEESNAHRAQVMAEAEQQREEVEKAAAKVREAAERFAREHRAAAQAEAEKIVNQARSTAAQLRNDAERDAAATREQAQGHFEEVRAKAAAAAAEFETNLAHRREQAERDQVQRMEAAEKLLIDTEQRTEHLRADSEREQADAQRRADQVLTDAKAKAEDMIREATSKANRINLDAERDLAAIEKRRAAVELQLKNVRQVLATLSGGAMSDFDLSSSSGPPSDSVTSGSPGESDSNGTKRKVTDSAA